MNVGVVGLGKVGLSLALVARHTGGHSVFGYDVDTDRVRERLADPSNRGEAGLGRLIETDAAARRASGPRGGVVVCDDVDAVVRACDVVFVVVQTPHALGYGGDRPVPWETADFDYSFLRAAVDMLGDAVDRGVRDRLTVVVVSTVLPGTTRRELLPRVGSNVTLVYSPVFISLGRIVPDLLDPSFILVGTEPRGADVHVERVFRRWTRARVYATGLEEAELLKVSHNCWISMKIVFANQLAQLCERLGDVDVDDVTNGLALTGDRVLRAGLGDGGACRPRDAIAMTHLARSVGVPDSVFSYLTHARELHSAWVEGVARSLVAETRMPAVVLGRAYKPDVPYEFGSPAALLAYRLGSPETWDPVAGDAPREWHEPRVFVVGTNHTVFDEVKFPEGSVVVDPWGSVRDRPGVRVVRLGRREK